MADYYDITVRITFGVLAKSPQEAERLAQEFCQIEGEVPAGANIEHEAYKTPNQADHIKREAVNHIVSLNQLFKGINP